MDFSERFNSLCSRTEDFSNYSNIELEALLHEAKDTQQEYKNLQLVVKADANSLYGVSASIYFSLNDFDIAEDITTTGKHFAVIVDHALNNWLGAWANFPEILKKIQEYYPQVISLRNFTEYVADTKNDFCVYGDTDSRYCDTELLYKLMITESGPMKLPDNNDELSNFVLFVMDNFINALIKKTIETDCEARGARKGYLRMNHEVTTRKGAFLKKKKYIFNSIWEDGKMLTKPKLKFKGVELRKGSSSPRIKKILTKLLDKYLIEGFTNEQLRIECIKLITYIKNLKDKTFIYQISSVSGLKSITKTGNKWSSDKNHIQMQIAVSWYNFIEDKKGLYRPPFEGQKMMYYYCDENCGHKLIGIPDDVDLNKIEGLPPPDWNKMLNNVLLKPLLRYIYDKEDIDDRDVEYFILGIKQWQF